MNSLQDLQLNERRYTYGLYIIMYRTKGPLS